MDCIRQPFQTMFTLRHRLQQRDSNRAAHRSPFNLRLYIDCNDVGSQQDMRYCAYNLRLYIDCNSKSIQLCVDRLCGFCA